MWLKSFKKGIHDFGENIAVIVNTILLFIVYIIGVGITSIVAKIFGKHFMELKIDNNKDTYWSDLNIDKKSMEDYYRQF